MKKILIVFLAVCVLITFFSCKQTAGGDPITTPDAVAEFLQYIPDIDISLVEQNTVTSSIMMNMVGTEPYMTADYSNALNLAEDQGLNFLLFYTDVIKEALDYTSITNETIVNIASFTDGKLDSSLENFKEGLSYPDVMGKKDSADPIIREQMREFYEKYSMGMMQVNVEAKEVYMYVNVPIDFSQTTENGEKELKTGCTKGQLGTWVTLLKDGNENDCAKTYLKIKMDGNKTTYTFFVPSGLDDLDTTNNEFFENAHIFEVTRTESASATTDVTTKIDWKLSSLATSRKDSVFSIELDKSKVNDTMDCIISQKWDDSLQEIDSFIHRDGANAIYYNAGVEGGVIDAEISYMKGNDVFAYIEIDEDETRYCKPNESGTYTLEVSKKNANKYNSNIELKNDESMTDDALYDSLTETYETAKTNAPDTQAISVFQTNFDDLEDKIEALGFLQ